MFPNAVTLWIVRVCMAGAAVLLFGLWAYGRGIDRGREDLDKHLLADKAAEAKAQEDVRRKEQAIAANQAQAGNDAEARNAEIQAEYERRLAGADADNRRLRQHWAACETGRLSGDSAAAAASAEQDRLRAASRERVLRAVRLAQSERDEAVERYEAVRAER